MTLVPLTPITAGTRYRAAVDIVPPPSEDQMPRLQAFRGAPGHRDRPASPADSHVGMWPAYQGGKILVVKFGPCQLPGRLDELLASG